MNKTEMGKILYIMQEQYRAENITERTINAWWPIFQSYEYKIVELAVMLMANERKFTSFPAPASLVEYISIIEGKADPSALWELAYRAMGKCTTFTLETFNELPEQIRMFFGSLNQLREYGLADIDELKFTKLDFMKELPTIETRIMARKETAKLLDASKGQLDEQHQAQLNRLIGG